VGCTAFFADNDSDGFGVGASQCLCSPKNAFTAVKQGDCNDGQNTVYPGAQESCDGVDSNCDGVGDGAMGFTQPCGGSGVGQCTKGVESCTNAGTWQGCTAVLPSAESCGGGDEDCDGQTNEEGAECCTTFFLDSDGDGFGSGQSKCLCAASGQYNAVKQGDCNNSNNNIFPGAAEICDGVDSNCDGVGDGAMGFTRSCGSSNTGNCSVGVESCNNAGTWQGCTAVFATTESCGGGDEDCDGQSNEQGAKGCTHFFADSDNDGYGVGSSKCLCGPSGEFKATKKGDCNDGAGNINPGAFDGCDAIDNNCDGQVDNGASCKQKVYRWYYGGSKANHFYTTNSGEKPGSYQFEGVAYKLYTNEVNGTFKTVKLYRSYNPGWVDHFYTTNYSEFLTTGKDWNIEGVMGYCSPNKAPGTVALYRAWHPNVYDHFYTTSWPEMNNAKSNLGYNYEGIQCYVWPN
jgi:hypothetical protein